MSITKTCPSCGGPLAFAPGRDVLVCSNCKGEFSLDSLRSYQEYEHPFEVDEPLNEEPETLTVHCPGCGGECTLPPNTVAGFCQNCTLPLVASSQSVRSIRPEGIIPFAQTREAAGKTFRKWLRSRWFLPSGVKRQCRLSEMLVGAYRPMWTFDFSAETRYLGERGTEYTVTRTRRRNGETETYTETRVRWSSVRGMVFTHFDDVLVYGSSQVSRELQREVGNWRLDSAKAYEESLVQGFVEESYDIGRKAGYEEAQSLVGNQIDTTIRGDIGGDRQRISSRDSRYYDNTYKLLLVPFWHGRYFYGGKEYLYLVNGQTGASHGERPWSKWKIALFVLAVAGALLYLCDLFNSVP